MTELPASATEAGDQAQFSAGAALEVGTEDITELPTSLISARKRKMT